MNNLYLFERNYGSEKKLYTWNWGSYFEKQLNTRKNWKQIYLKDTSTLKSIDLVYTINKELSFKSKITSTIYRINELLGNKVTINKEILSKYGSRYYLPKTFFIHVSELQNLDTFISRLKDILSQTKTFFYLKASSGSFSRSTYIINNYKEVIEILQNNDIPDWLLSENIDSLLYRKPGEQYGHKGKLRYMLLLRIDSESRDMYLYPRAIYELAFEEFKGDYTSTHQNIIGGDIMDSRYNYDYETYIDYALDPHDIFGNETYKNKILPQLLEISKELFEIVKPFLNCRNDLLYNNLFKSCFQLLAVDIIVDKDLKCHFLEVNTKPFMSYRALEERMDFTSMIDGVIQLCIDPYIKPSSKTVLSQEWVHISQSPRSKQFKVYFLSDKWRLSRNIIKSLENTGGWRSAIYPKNILPNYHVDLVGKRGIKKPVIQEDSMIQINDPIFEKGILISKISTLQHYLGNKKIMYDILSNDPRSFVFLPLTATFNVTQDDYKSIIQFAMSYSSKIRVWILKPALGLQGKDIFISDNYEDVIKQVSNKIEYYTDWVLSQYLDNPFLLKLKGESDSGARYSDQVGRKNHIRIYVLITKIDSEYHIYLYYFNLIFAAVKEYNHNDFTDEYSNLTNLHLASIYYENMLKLDGKDAYKDLSFNLESSVNELFGPGFYNEKVFPQIKNMLSVILDNSKEYLFCMNSQNKSCRGCFQYIALDLMPDAHFNLYLLEVNARPGMNAPNYHWGNLQYFADSLLDKTMDMVYGKNKKLNKNGFILIA